MYGWTDDVIGPQNRTVEGQAPIPAGYRLQIREDVEQAPVPVYTRPYCRSEGAHAGASLRDEWAEGVHPRLPAGDARSDRGARGGLGRP